MNDMNRLLIFLLLVGLLYALYKYQHLIFGQIKCLSGESKYEKLPKNIDNKNNKDNKNKLKYNNLPKNKDNVGIDNISQLSLGSLEDENGNPQIYKQDSILGSIDSKSLFSNSNGSIISNESNMSNSNGSVMSNGSKASNNSSFFF